ncbi:hypothetical protein ABPG72_015342 [Tetrahymena utriculariae]
MRTKDSQQQHSSQRGNLNKKVVVVSITKKKNVIKNNNNNNNSPSPYRPIEEIKSVYGKSIIENPHKKAKISTFIELQQKRLEEIKAQLSLSNNKTERINSNHHLPFVLDLDNDEQEESKGDFDYEKDPNNNNQNQKMKVSLSSTLINEIDDDEDDDNNNKLDMNIAFPGQSFIPLSNNSNSKERVRKVFFIKNNKNQEIANMFISAVGRRYSNDYQLQVSEQYEYNRPNYIRVMLRFQKTSIRSIQLINVLQEAIIIQQQNKQHQQQQQSVMIILFKKGKENNDLDVDN